jgi:hypothetical protein
VSNILVAEDPDANTPVATAVVAPILVVGKNLEIEITLIDANGAGIAGGFVAGDWSYTDRRGKVRVVAASGTTDEAGSLLLTRRLVNGASDYSFCVTEATVPGYEFVMPPLSCGYVLD